MVKRPCSSGGFRQKARGRYWRCRDNCRAMLIVILDNPFGDYPDAQLVLDSLGEFGWGRCEHLTRSGAEQVYTFNRTKKLFR